MTLFSPRTWTTPRSLLEESHQQSKKKTPNDFNGIYWWFTISAINIYESLWIYESLMVHALNWVTFDFPGSEEICSSLRHHSGFPAKDCSTGMKHHQSACRVSCSWAGGWSKTSYTMRRSSDLHEPTWRWVSVQMLKHWSESWWAEVLTDPKFQWHGKLT